MACKLKTSVLIEIEGAQIERECVIEYTRVKAYLSPGRESPDEPAHCTIDGVSIAGDDGRLHDAYWLIGALTDDDDIQALLMEDWDADDARHEEYRADAARDERMMEGR